MESIFRAWSDSFVEGQRIPEGFAFAKIDPTGAEKTVSAGNRNPQISWSVPPRGTQSLIIICEDPDAPIDFTSANREGETIAVDVERANFVHWLLVDIAPEESSIDAGQLSKGITIRGKKGPACANGMRQGLNDYTDAFADDPQLAGHYYGYDGPCPPWNDMKVHRYIFTVYAMDFPLLPIDGPFNARQLKAAMKGHVLASSSITGTYTLNKDLLNK